MTAPPTPRTSLRPRARTAARSAPRSARWGAACRVAPPRRRDGELEEIAHAALGCRGQGLQRCGACRFVARRADAREPRHLRLADLGVVDVEEIDLRLLVGLVLVDADDDLLAAIDA